MNGLNARVCVAGKSHREIWSSYMRIVWKETLAAGKFGIFVVKLILAEANLTNLPILGLKII